MMKPYLDLKLSNWGIANRYPDRIELNRHLLKDKYHPLFFELVSHELEHSQGWGTKDFLLDLKGFNHKKLYWQFVLSHPRSWVNFSPLYRSMGIWYIDASILIVYVLSLFIIILTWTIIN